MSRSTTGLLFVLLLSSGLFITLGHGHDTGTAAARADKQIITMPGSTPSGFPFSSAVKVGNLMFVSGVVGTDVKTNKLVSEEVTDQTRMCLEKLRSIVVQGGMELSDVVNCTVYLTDINDYDAMNKVYAMYFPKEPPARACVQVAKLVRGAKVEITLIAEKAR